MATSVGSWWEGEEGDYDDGSRMTMKAMTMMEAINQESFSLVSLHGVL